MRTYARERGKRQRAQGVVGNNNNNKHRVDRGDEGLM